MSKAHLREHFKKIRKELTTEYRLSANETIFYNFFSLLKTLSAPKNIVGYRAINHELDINHILDELVKIQQYNILFPELSLDKDEMYFNSIDKNFYTDQVDLLIIPLLAVDLAGYRLGYGKGFYDKKIAHLQQNNINPILLGICFDAQITDHLPFEKHDQKLHYLVTDKRSVSFG